MRALLLTTALLAAAAGCGGNWSNEDLEFLGALPSRELLRAEVVDESLAQAAPAGEAAALTLGQESNLFRETVTSGRNFNRAVDNLLALLEAITDLPVTTREPDRRTWGPFPDRNQPGFDVRFVMDRTDGGARFTYHLDYRARGSTDEAAWFPFISGEYVAGTGLRRGTGEVHLDVAGLEARGQSAGDLSNLERMDIAYQKDRLPYRVQLTAKAEAGQPVTDMDYVYRELGEARAERLAEMAFRYRGEFVPGTQVETVAVTTRWSHAAAAGISTLRIEQGDFAGATEVQCWDARGLTTFESRSWDGSRSGDAARCPDVSALGP